MACLVCSTESVEMLGAEKMTLLTSSVLCVKRRDSWADAPTKPYHSDGNLTPLNSIKVFLVETSSPLHWGCVPSLSPQSSTKSSHQLSLRDFLTLWGIVLLVVSISIWYRYPVCACSCVRVCVTGLLNLGHSHSRSFWWRTDLISMYKRLLSAAKVIENSFTSIWMFTSLSEVFNISFQMASKVPSNFDSTFQVYFIH